VNMNIFFSIHFVFIRFDGTFVHLFSMLKKNLQSFSIFGILKQKPSGNGSNKFLLHLMMGWPVQVAKNHGTLTCKGRVPGQQPP
jgi:hypothetical protein